MFAAMQMGRMGLVSSGADAPPPATNFAVLPAAGTPTYTVTRNVLSSTGAVFVAPGTVLSSGGTSYTPI